MKQNISDLMKRIQSVTYIPKYSDGKAYVKDGVVELDFQISPKDAVNAIAANWQSILSVKAVYTITRAVSFIDMPILSCDVDSANGVLTITASGADLSEEFFIGTQSANVVLCISDGNNEVTSGYVPMVPSHPYNEIWYTSTDGSPVVPSAVDVFGANIVSNSYVGSRGVIKFDGPVTSVGDSAFKECSTLATIELPELVTEIGTSALHNCKSLVSISISANVTSIGSLGTMSNLEAIYIQDLSAWCRIDRADVSFKSGVRMYVKGEELTQLVIPSDVTEVKQYAFARLSNLTNVMIHDKVMSVGDYAFAYCSNLSEVTIGDGATSIGSNAFYNCSNLSEVTIGKGVTLIRSQAFVNCSNLLTIYCRAEVPPSIYHRVGYGQVTRVFPENTGMKIYVPESSYSAYRSYTSYKSDENSPQNWSVYKSYIVSYDYGYEPEPQPVTEGNKIYYTTTDGKPMTVYKPESVNAQILSNTYENGVGEITCVEDITEIDNSAFKECKNLETITFPSTVTKYGIYVMSSCSSLKEIYIKSTTPPAIYYQYAQIGSFPFSSSVTIYVPREAYEVYTQYTGWADMSYNQMNWSQHKSQLQPYDFE